VAQEQDSRSGDYLQHIKTPSKELKTDSNPTKKARTSADRGQPCALREKQRETEQKTLGGGKIKALQRSEKLKQEKRIAHAAPKSGREKPSGSERKIRWELRRKDLALDLTGGKSNPAQNQERKFRARKILGWQLGHVSRKRISQRTARGILQLIQNEQGRAILPQN
jgi:hypothetical protein